MNASKAMAIGAALAVAGATGWTAYRRVAERAAPPSRGGARAVAVVVEPVRTETIFEEAEFVGTLLPRSRFVLAPKASGRLERLLKDLGDEVRNGDLVAILDSEEYAQQVAQTQAELDVARAAAQEAESALEAAASDWRRLQYLHRERIASDAQLEEVRARHRAAEARVEVARAQIRQRAAALAAAETRLGYTRLHAAWEGDGVRYVAERFADEGALLRANDPVVSIVDTRSLVAVVHVIERDFPAMAPGLAARVRSDAHPDRTFIGRVTRRAPALDERSRHARVEIEVDNADNLLAPGMFARVGIRFSERENARVAPRAALARRNGQQGVFLADVETETARFVPIETGIMTPLLVEVLDPAIEGLAITLGHHLLEDGAAIALPSAGDRKDSPRGDRKR